MFAYTLSRGGVEVKVTSRATQRSGRGACAGGRCDRSGTRVGGHRSQARLPRIATNRDARFDEPPSAAPDRSGARTRPDPSVFGLGSGTTALVLAPVRAGLSQWRPSATRRGCGASRNRASRRREAAIVASASFHAPAGVPRGFWRVDEASAPGHTQPRRRVGLPCARARMRVSTRASRYTCWSPPAGQCGLVCGRRALAPGAEVFGAEDRRPELARAACRSAGLRRRRCLGSQRAAAAIPTRLTYPRPSGWRPSREPRRDEPTRRARRTPAERTGLRRSTSSVRRENPNVGGQTLHGRQLFAAGFPLQHDADRCASNSKMCYTPISALTGRNRKAGDLQAFQ